MLAVWLLSVLWTSWSSVYVSLTSPHFSSCPLGCSPAGSRWWRPWTWGGWWPSSQWRPERPRGSQSPHNERELESKRRPPTDLWMLLPGNALTESDIRHRATSKTNASTGFDGEVFPLLSVQIPPHFWWLIQKKKSFAFISPLSRIKSTARNAPTPQPALLF